MSIQIKASELKDSLIAQKLREKIGTLAEADDSDSTIFYALKMLSRSRLILFKNDFFSSAQKFLCL
jgi:hypothetical protein